MTDPQLSVVISNHNYADYLAEAVTSASSGAQQVTTQVIVVDDGSTDSSGLVLDALPGEVEQVRQPNGGQGAAMNAGFALARAPVVIFLDADDRLLPGTGAAVLRAIDASGAGRVQYPMVAVDADGRRLGWQLPEPGVRLPVGDLRERVLTNPDDIPWQPTSGNAFRSEVLRQILPMPTAPYRISADHYLSNLTPLYGDLAALPMAGAAYRVHDRNNDHREDFDLRRTRDVIVRTVATHAELTRHARALGLACALDDARSASVTFNANRLLSLRLDPASHPIRSDRRRALLSDGIRAAHRRRDARLARRGLMAGWFVVASIVPRRLLPRLARAALRR